MDEKIVKKIRELLRENPHYSFKELGKKMRVSTTVARNAWVYSGGEVNRRKVPQHVKTDADGVIYVARPDWYQRQSDMVKLSQVMYCKAHGLAKIPYGHKVIHKNGNTRDFSLSNLAMVHATYTPKVESETISVFDYEDVKPYVETATEQPKQKEQQKQEASSNEEQLLNWAGKHPEKCISLVKMLIREMVSWGKK